MAMLRDFPIYFGSEQIPRPIKWQEKYENVDSVNSTEAGTDQVLVVRYGKLSVSAQFNCSSRWAAKFVTYAKGPIDVKAYDLETQDYKTRSMRLRNLQVTLEENSYNMDGTIGLYTVACSLEEY